MQHLSLAAMALVVAALGSACAATPASRPAPVERTSTAAAAAFTSVEIDIIRDYYRNRGDSSVQHGKGKHKHLPPGIAKNLARGKPLPPGIAKRALPGDLVAALPPVRPGHERVVIDGRVLLVEVATQVVRDVLYDVVMS